MVLIIMDISFWQQRWRENKIGFHQPDFSTLLSSYWDQLEVPAGSTVFVPLCGKSQDLIWLTKKGFQVVAVELSELAVKAFFEENQFSFNRQQHDGYSVWQTDNIRILCGDFFTLNKNDIGQVDAVYDRAALIALPEDMRRDYLEQMCNLVGQVAMLLITLEYPQSQMQGPPFSVTEVEVTSLYDDKFTVKKVYDEDILSLEENQRFKQAGLSALSEKVFLLTI